jgi:hypothetical protein
MIVFGQESFICTFKKKIVIRNLCLDPDPDWIRIQQQSGSGQAKYLEPDPDSVNTD